MYVAYLHSSLKHGILFWGSTRNLKKNFKLQKRSNKANCKRHKHYKLQTMLQKIKDYDFTLYNKLHKSTKVKKVCKWKPILTRLLGRPKNIWEDDIRNDVKKLKIKNWTSCIQDRNNWKLYVEEARTFND
jgi:hypothetical protein